MKKGGSEAAKAGFTIVETMIVLAVTGSMLLIAVAFVSGRQNQTEFQTGINDLQQQLQQFANQTASGQYTNDGSFGCDGTGSLVTLNASPTQQGSNKDCIFLGNIIQFGTGSSDDAKSTIGVIPIVGKQFVNGLNPVQTVTDAMPRAVYALGGETSPTSIATQTMKYGLSVATSAPAPCPAGVGMCFTTASDGPQPTGAIGLIAGDGNSTLASVGDDGNLKSGAQQFTLYGVRDTTPNQATPTVAAKIGNYPAIPAAPSDIEPATSAIVCIQSGTTPESGLFTITADWHVTLKIFETSTTCGA